MGAGDRLERKSLTSDPHGNRSGPGWVTTSKLLHGESRRESGADCNQSARAHRL